MWNYQVKDLANAVAKVVPGVSVYIIKDAQPDKRSYKVGFSLFRKVASDHQALMTLEGTILELKEGFEAMSFADPSFRESNFMRLKMLESHIRDGH